MAETSDLHLGSLHREMSSPFLISQVRTSSFAGTTARPALVRDVLLLSGVHMAFAVPEATIPKVRRCSNRLYCRILC